MISTEKIKSLLCNSYYIVANTLIVLVIVVVCAHLILKHVSYSTVHNYAAKLSREERQAYSHMSDQEINEMLNSTWSPALGGYNYDEWIGFKEAPRKTRYVNVNEYGLRQNSTNTLIMQELSDSIWFFGGSTTFGYGVTDRETIPAQLEKLLKTRVYNFGRGYFYSAQENQLFRQYLKAGHRPRLAIFLDGINERCTIGVYQDSMKALFHKASNYSWDFAEAVSPVVLLTDKLVTKLDFKFPQRAADTATTPTNNIHDISCSSYGIDQPLTKVLQQNLLERQFICAQYSVTCITYVQPFAGVHGIHSDEEALKESDRTTMKEQFTLLETVWADSGAIFITNALDNLKIHAYVDNYHYSAEANALIAKEIAKKLDN
jgi:hypothetical protein